MADAEAVQLEVKIKHVDMPEAMQAVIIEKTQEAFAKFKIEKDVATMIKKFCDESENKGELKFGGTWHCIVGKNFGCSISFETKFSMFFEIGLKHVLIFKSIE